MKALFLPQAIFNGICVESAQVLKYDTKYHQCHFIWGVVRRIQVKTHNGQQVKNTTEYHN